MATRMEELAVPWVERGPAAELRTGWRHRVLSRVLALPTDEELAREISRDQAAEADLPERVSPDDPDRLALEAELRAIGVQPAKVWNFPVRASIRKPGWRDWIRNRLGG